MKQQLRMCPPRRSGGVPKRREPRIDARFAAEIVAEAARAGYNAEALLKRAGIDPKFLSDPGARISRRSLAALLLIVGRVTGDESWLTCRQPIRPGAFRTLCRLLIGCRSVGEAIREGSRFYRLVTDEFRIGFRLEDGDVCLTVTDTLETSERRPRLHGTVLLFAYGLVCWLGGKRAQLRGVDHSFERNCFSAELAKVYGVPIRYGQPRSQLRLPKEILDWSIVPDESELAPFLASVPGALLVRYQGESKCGDRIRSILRRHVQDNPSIETVAAMLATSPQTLRRRLKDEEGLGFQHLKDEVRRQLACEALTNTDLPIDAVAAHLGFSEASTFHRAFRRWSDRTPTAFRQQAHGRANPVDDGDGRGARLLSGAE